MNRVAITSDLIADQWFENDSLSSTPAHNSSSNNNNNSSSSSHSHSHNEPKIDKYDEADGI